MQRKVFEAAIALSLSIFFVLLGCESPSPILGEKPLKRIYLAENDADELRIWTDVGAKADVLIHIDSADDMGIFPKSIMDTLAATAKLIRLGDLMMVGRISSLVERGSLATVGYMAGMYDRVIWVIPAARPTGEEDPQTFRKFFIENRKFPPDAVGDFAKKDGVVSGTLAGIPLEIARLEELKLGPKEKAIVDIDLSYFQVLSTSRAGYKTGIESLLSFLRSLAGAGLRVRLVTVNLSTQSNDVPMDLRYYGRVIAEALAKPELLEPPLPEKWKLIAQAEDSMRAGNYASAAALYRDASKLDPENPGIHFALGVALGFDEKGAESTKPLLEAYYLDHEYLRGIFQLARILGAAGKVKAGSEILDAPELGRLLGEGELDYQRGIFFYSARRPFDAATYLARASRYRQNDFGLYTVLFRAFRDMGDARSERDALQRLLEIDEGRVKREMPWVYVDLGELYQKAGFPGSAKDLYRKYIELRPADSLSSVLKKRVDSLDAVLKAWRSR